MKKFLLAAVFTLLVIGCSEPEPDVTIDVKGTFNQAEADIVTNAINAFKKSCAPLFEEYWQDVISATAGVESQIMDAGEGRTLKMPFAEKYGWHDTIQLVINVSESPEKIPTQFNAAGHTLYYRLGGGDQPGVSVNKMPSALICGYDNIEVISTADLHVSIPAMVSLDDL